MLGGGVGFGGLVPEGTEVGVAVAVKVGVGDDRFDILQGKSRFDFATFFKADAVEAGDEALAEELYEVGLAAAELDDAIDRILVVVEGEVVGGVGDEFAGG